MTTLIQNADVVVAWDDAAQQHVYLADADVAFEGGTLRFVGRGYDGPAETVMDRQGHHGDARPGEHPQPPIQRAR